MHRRDQAYFSEILLSNSMRFSDEIPNTFTRTEKHPKQINI
jgi:hypothetical protein